jgi:hypothetical protein
LASLELLDWMRKKWAQRKKVTYKKGIVPTLSTMFLFGSEMPYLKGDFLQREFEEDWCHL